MASYCVWQDVVDIMPTASQIESNSTNQTNLITDKSNEFQTYIRNRHRADLESPVDEVVKKAVANLVADELRHRRLSEDDDLEVAQFTHTGPGKFTRFGIEAHRIIQDIRGGVVVLSQDEAERDAHFKDVTVVTQPNGTGVIESSCPDGYQATTKDVWQLICTTTGRVDDETNRFKAVKNSDQIDVTTGIQLGNGWTELGNGLYVRARDTASTGDSFEANDEFKIIAIPIIGTETSTDGPRQAEVYSSG